MHNIGGVKQPPSYYVEPDFQLFSQFQEIEKQPLKLSLDARLSLIDRKDFYFYYTKK